MNRRGQLVILAFLVAVLAYLVVVWRAQSTPNPPKAESSAQPTPAVNPTAGWATYSSPDPAFSIKYPAGWAVLSQALPVIISNQTDLASQAPATKFLLADSRPGTTLDACYAVSGYNQGYTYTSKTVSLNGQPASRYTIDPKPGAAKPAYATAYLLIHNGRCYDVTLASMSAAARDRDAGLVQTMAESLRY